MELMTVMADAYERFEEDSAVLKGLRQRANDKGFTTVGEAIDAAPKNKGFGGF